MNELSSAIVTLGEVALSVSDWLVYLKRGCRLLPLLREAVLDRLIVQRAMEAGLAVTDGDLQQAADRFRLRNGLTGAEQTRAWLSQQGLTQEDFETGLEGNLLREKFKLHLTEPLLAEHFKTHGDSYARARLRLILVAREDLARELAIQIRDEGQDFAELARAHSLHPSRNQGGLLGLVMRRQLAAASADAVFAARPGEVVGPLATPKGFQLFLIEALEGPSLDSALVTRIRQELFDAWLRDQFAAHPLDFPLLPSLR